MRDSAEGVVDHYATQSLMEQIEAGLKAAGVNPEAPTPDDLKPVDEFHTGGVEATAMILDPLGIDATARVLDVGSGIGGTARFIAGRYGAHVTGVDLTPAFVSAATELSERCGLGEKTTFHTGSALAMPVEDAAFDLATMMHVGMNIEDKPGLFRDVARALKPGGRFALFDIMKRGAGEITFPVPWASDPACSFVEDPQAYRDAAAAAGLVSISEHDRSDYAVDYFGRVIAAIEEHGVPPVGLHLIMGDTAQDKYANAVGAAMNGVTGPWEMVFGKPA